MGVLDIWFIPGLVTISRLCAGHNSSDCCQVISVEAKQSALNLRIDFLIDLFRQLRQKIYGFIVCHG